MTTTILADIAQRFDLARKSGKWVGPCPKCGGSATSDKFNLRDDGGFKCYACDFKGDLITWLREMDGLSCPEAHAAAELPCRTVTTCPAAASCRMGNGNPAARSAPRRAQSLTPSPAAQVKTLPTATVRQPEQTWLSWATALAAAAAAEIHKQKGEMAWLAARGLDAAAVTRFALGWLPKNTKVTRAAISLPEKEGKETLWIPAGLLIRINNPDGSLHRLRIRRPTWAREKFLPERKYVWLEGSGTAPLVIRPQGKSRGTVVIEAELDAYATAAAHPEVTVIALGTVSASIPADLRTELAEAPVILLALDADPGSNGKPGAGPAALAAWRHEFRQSRFWPVPAGKDPGDYVKHHQGNLRAWVEAGLIPPATAAHDAMSTPGSISTGGKGVQIEQPATPVAHAIVTLADGREIHVVKDEEAWRKLAAQGKLVFSENEMARLQRAMYGAEDDERLRLVDAALEVKMAFGSAYISAGRSAA